ncbi:MAG TPA: GNAT family N-acetyltransferase [Solirubrobacteraceae bacterium]
MAKIGMPMLDRFDEFSDRGGELCIADTAEDVVAAIWIFRTQMPLYPWLELPDGVAAIEHAVIADRLRGHGHMPAVADAIAERLRLEGFHTIVLKIVDINQSSLRAVSKIGFRPVALMHQVRIAGTRRTIVEPATGIGRYLAKRLAGSTPLDRQVAEWPAYPDVTE